MDETELHYDKIVPVTVVQADREAKTLDLRIRILSIYRQAASSVAAVGSTSWRRSSSDDFQLSQRYFGSNALSDNSNGSSSSSASAGNCSSAVFRTGYKTKQLKIQFTDESDLFFLYTGIIGEEEFTRIKTEHNIQSEFREFHERLIDLIERSIQGSQQGGKRYFNRFQFGACGAEKQILAPNSASAAAAAATAPAQSPADGIFSIVQDDEFRHLNYLDIRLRAGNDMSIKEYLATELKLARKRCLELEKQFLSTRDNLSSRLSDAERSNAEIRQRYDTLVHERDRQVHELRLQHQEQQAKLDKDYTQQLQTLREQLESEKISKIEQSQQTVSSLQEKYDALLAENKTLASKCFEQDAQLKQLSSRLTHTESELLETKSELSHLRGENKSLDSTKHENEKAINKNSIKISALQQEVRDKEKLVEELRIALESERSQVDTLKETYEIMKSRSRKYEDKYQQAIREIHKGNSIIERHENKIKTLQQSKEHLKSTVSQIEQLLRVKLEELKKCEGDRQALREEVAQLQAALEKTRTQVQDKLAEFNAQKLELEKERQTTSSLAEQIMQLKGNAYRSSRYSGFSFASPSAAVTPAPAPAPMSISVPTANTATMAATASTSILSNDDSVVTARPPFSPEIKGPRLASALAQINPALLSDFDENGSYRGAAAAASSSSSSQRPSAAAGTGMSRYLQADDGMSRGLSMQNQQGDKIFFDVNSADSKKFM